MRTALLLLPAICLFLALSPAGPALAQPSASRLCLVRSPFTTGEAKVQADNSVALAFTTFMPQEGWKLTLDGGAALEKGTISLKMTLVPPESPGPSGFVPLTVTANTGPIAAGSYNVDIWWRKPGGEYRLRALYQLQVNARSGQPGTLEYALLSASFHANQPGELHNGPRGIALKRKGATTELHVTEGTPYRGMRLRVDRTEEPDASNTVHLWLTCTDRHATDQPGVGPCVCGFATEEVKLPKLKAATCVVVVHYRPYDRKDTAYTISQRALLATEQPLSQPAPPPVRSRITGETSAANAPLWRAPAADAPAAKGACLLQSRFDGIYVTERAKGARAWQLVLQRKMPAGWSLKADSVQVWEHTGAVEVRITALPESAPKDTDGSRCLADLPALPNGRRRVEVWVREKDGPYALHACCHLEAGGAADSPAEADDVQGGTACPPAEMHVADLLTSAAAGRPETPTFTWDGSGTLAWKLDVGAYEGKPVVRKVEVDHVAGVVRVKLEVPFVKDKPTQPRTETVTARVQGLKSGTYTLELLRLRGEEWNREQSWWLEAQ